METILAVDLKKGKVVRAFAGFRSNYKPLKELLITQVVMHIVMVGEVLLEVTMLV